MKVLNPKHKYWRLLKLVVGMGLLSSLFGFVALCFWDYGFTFPHFTMGLFITRAGYALAHGLLAGVYTGFPVWLALESFRKPKTITTNQGAVRFLPRRRIT